MPSVCALGTCEDLTVSGCIGDRTYDIKPDDITVSVVYGKSNKQKTIKAELNVWRSRKKYEYVSCIVPFTPKCGGKHCIVLGAVEGKKTFEFTTTVSGRPAVGAKVCRDQIGNTMITIRVLTLGSLKTVKKTTKLL